MDVSQLPQSLEQNSDTKIPTKWAKNDIEAFFSTYQLQVDRTEEETVTGIWLLRATAADLQAKLDKSTSSTIPLATLRYTKGCLACA